MGLQQGTGGAPAEAVLRLSPPRRWCRERLVLVPKGRASTRVDGGCDPQDSVAALR